LLAKTMSIAKRSPLEEVKSDAKRMSLQPGKRGFEANFNLRIVNIKR